MLLRMSLSHGFRYSSFCDLPVNIKICHSEGGFTGRHTDIKLITLTHSLNTCITSEKMERSLKKDAVPFYPITANLIINGSPLVHASNICEPAVED
jgi:hypothetical protein